MAGIALLVFGAVVLALLDQGVPDRARLIQVSGQLSSLEKTTSKGGGLSSVRFTLASDPRHFRYLSQAGQIEEVWTALERAGQAEVGVLIDPDHADAPPIEDRSFHTAFEVRVGNEVIRAHARVVESWGANNLLGAGLGYGSAAAGIALLVTYFLKRRRAGGPAVVFREN